MKVKVRHLNDSTAEARDFTECRFNQLDDLIAFVQRSGGFYLDGNHEPFFSYQLVLDEGKAYAEIIVGGE